MTKAISIIYNNKEVKAYRLKVLSLKYVSNWQMNLKRRILEKKNLTLPKKQCIFQPMPAVANSVTIF